MTQIIRITGAPVTRNRPSLLGRWLGVGYSKIGSISGAGDISGEDLQIGQKVYHQRFGEMVVTNIRLHPNTDIADVVLPNGETKSLALKYANLFTNKRIFNNYIKENNIIPGEHTPITFKTEDNPAGGTFFGDYVKQGASNRHLEARADENKLTAGEMAKVLSQILKRKILASDISHLATEWHHAGVFYNKYTKRTSGKKVFFFTKNDINRLTEILK